MKTVNKVTRKFLNKKEGLAAIECGIDVSNYCVNAGVSITDCNRKVSLDFCIYDAKEYDAKLAKLELVINELAELYTTMDMYKEAWITDKESRDMIRKKEAKRYTVSSLDDLLN